MHNLILGYFFIHIKTNAKIGGKYRILWSNLAPKWTHTEFTQFVIGDICPLICEINGKILWH